MIPTHSGLICNCPHANRMTGMSPMQTVTGLLTPFASIINVRGQPEIDCRKLYHSKTG
jgi:hypothetical protein